MFNSVVMSVLYSVFRFKDKTPTPLTNLDMLLEGTHR